MAAAKNEIFTKASSFAREIYLANLGVASSAYEHAQDLLKQSEEKYKDTEAKAKDVYAKRNEIFDGLVNRGEKLQNDALSFFEDNKSKAQSKFEASKAQAKSKFEELKSESNAAVEERMKDLRGSFEKVKGSISRKAADTAEAVQ